MASMNYSCSPQRRVNATPCIRPRGSSGTLASGRLREWKQQGLLKGQAAEWAKDRLLATAIFGRKVFSAAIEGRSSSIGRAYEFAIKVGERGEISLAGLVTVAPKDKY